MEIAYLRSYSRTLWLFGCLYSKEDQKLSAKLFYAMFPQDTILKVFDFKDEPLFFLELPAEVVSVTDTLAFHVEFNIYPLEK